MHVIGILIAVSLLFALIFLTCFIWAVRAGQFEDTLTPSFRVLTEEEPGRVGPENPNEIKNLPNHHEC